MKMANGTENEALTSGSRTAAARSERAIHVPAGIPTSAPMRNPTVASVNVPAAADRRSPSTIIRPSSGQGLSRRNDGEKNLGPPDDLPKHEEQGKREDPSSYLSTSSVDQKPLTSLGKCEWGRNRRSAALRDPFKAIATAMTTSASA